MATVNATDVVDGDKNQHEINSGLPSISHLLAVNNPADGMRFYVKSYHVDRGIGGGWFMYNSTKTEINDGVIIFNGWIREKKEVYYIEDAGILADSGFDNTPLFNNFIQAVPEYSKVLFKTEGEYIGQFTSNKAFDIDFNNSVLKLPKTISNGNVVSFSTEPTTLTLVGNRLDKYCNSATISGIHQIEKGDILTFWDRLTRPTDGSPVHFETVSVRAVQYIDSNTVVQFNEILFSPFSSDINILCYWYNKPLVRPAVRNYRVHDNDTNVLYCIRFVGCMHPESKNGYVQNNYGHACSFFNSISPKSHIFHCETPRNPDVGGYGVVFSRCRNLTAIATTGYRTRHAVDADSCYGDILVDGVEDLDAISALVGVAHNGYANGNVVIKNAHAYTRRATPTVRLNKQGITSENLEKHTIDNLYLENISLTITAETLLTGQYFAAYCDVFCDKVVAKNLTMRHTNIDLHKTSSAPSCAFRFYGYARSVEIDGTYADTCQRNILIQNETRAKVGKAKIRNINTSHQRSAGIVRGFALDIDSCTYNELSQGMSNLITFQEISLSGSNVTASYLNVRNVSYISGDINKQIPVISRSSFISTVSGKIDFIANTTSNISVTNYADGIPEYEFYRRFGVGFIYLSSTSDVTVGGDRPLPQPLISNGMDITLVNANSVNIKIERGIGNSQIILTPNQRVQIVSRNGVWVPL
ncbi:hypothetical protein LF296_08075 [Acinetobacter vivianii]|uniref:Uncharacterized protein n=1 Tax=Acinetobacter vivianii TaxID=1776742 RepID=A0AAJ6NLR5_9GAMM|nr:hypothetical protein [Acinetobacter vivianii]WDZ52724.1 hypothetical protein LF296_08075 [Acinetobacter vivianii]